MKTRLRAIAVSLLLITTLVPALPALAANGTVKVTFRYLDPVTGIDQNLTNAFIYLHDASKPAPMERFFSKADYILGGPSKYVSGRLTVSVPEGQYFIRVLQRKIIGGTPKPYGPPEAGDLTWYQTTPITIAANAVLDLGTKYAVAFSTANITITGTIKSLNGEPLQGRYVRAQTEPCQVPLNCTGSGCEQYGNKCGPTKFPAQRTTDANGSYELLLAEPGTYYIYTSPCLLSGHNQNDETRCPYTAAPAAVTVVSGDNITVNIVVN